MKINRRAALKRLSKDFAYVATLGICLPRSFAQIPVVPVRRKIVAAGGGGGCSTARDTASDTNLGSLNSDANKWMATRFTAGATTTICKCDIPLWKIGTPTDTLTLSIYSHNGGTNFPNASIDAADTKAASSITSTADPGETVSFDSGLSAAITSGTNYWVVLTASAGGLFDGNGVRWSYINGVSGDRSAVSGDGTTWSEFDPDDRFEFALFSA